MTAAATVDGFIGNAQQYAAESLGNAQTFINAAVLASQGSTNLPEAEFNFDSSQALPPDFGAAPADFSDVFTLPVSIPEPDVFSDVRVPTIPDFPQAPTALDTSDLFNQQKPDFDLQPFRETLPDVNALVDIPTAPTLTIPAEPVIESVTVRNAPEITIPQFNATLEARDIGPPPDAAQVFQSLYDTAIPEIKAWIDAGVDEWTRCYAPQVCELATELHGKIRSSMAEGSPLDPVFEQAVFDRSRQKAEGERNRQVDEITRSAAKRGYRRPPGSVVGGLSQATQAASHQIAHQASEIAIERARLEYQFATTVMQISGQVQQAAHQTMIQHAGMLLEVNGRALTFAQTTANFLLEAYRLVRERQGLLLEIYKTQAQVYETEIKSAFAVLDAYKIEIEGLKLKQDIEKTEIEKYLALIKGQESRVAIFAEEMKAVKIQADLELQKVQVFEAQVRAYLGQVQAKEAEFKAYEAALQGDAQKVNGYAQQVTAFGKEVDAVKTQVDAETAITRANIEQNKNISEQFRIEVAQFEAGLKAEGARYGGQVEAYKAALTGYSVKTRAELDEYRGRLEKIKLDFAGTSKEFDAKVQYAIKQADITLNRVKIQADTAISAANITNGIASAALTAQNSIVSLINSTELSE